MDATEIKSGVGVSFVITGIKYQSLSGSVSSVYFPMSEHLTP